jgi:hypothetical protein
LSYAERKNFEEKKCGSADLNTHDVSDTERFGN